VRGVDVAVDDEPGAVGLNIAVYVEAADVEVFGQRFSLHGVPGLDEFGGFIERVHFVSVPEAGGVGQLDCFVGEGGDDAEVHLAGAAEGKVEVGVGLRGDSGDGGVGEDDFVGDDGVAGPAVAGGEK